LPDASTSSSPSIGPFGVSTRPWIAIPAAPFAATVHTVAGAGASDRPPPSSPEIASSDVASSAGVVALPAEEEQPIEPIEEQASATAA
jgi:hypothetical protein